MSLPKIEVEIDRRQSILVRGIDADGKEANPELAGLAARVIQHEIDQINRPHGRLRIKTIIDGLIKFRQEYFGQVWLEILFVRGVNDSANEIERLVQAVEKIDPDRVQLNTVVRPPAEANVQPLKDRGYEVRVLDADSTNVGLHQAMGVEHAPASLLEFYGGAVFSGGAVT